MLRHEGRQDAASCGRRGAPGSALRAGLLVGLVVVPVACARLHVSPLAPPPYRADIAASYDRTWTALVRSVARQNVPLRAIARDSGVIASDEFITPIGVYADCGRIGDQGLEGEALVSFTLFAEPDGRDTRIQINSKMRTHAHRRGSSGSLRQTPVYSCASTGRFESNLFDAVKDLVKE